MGDDGGKIKEARAGARKNAGHTLNNKRANKQHGSNRTRASENG